MIKVVRKTYKMAKSSENRNEIKNLDDVESGFRSSRMHVSLNDYEEDYYRINNQKDRYYHTSNSTLGTGFHLQRIIFLGQIGSGRKTQAKLLAKRWDLVFLDFRVILLEYAKSKKYFHDIFTKVRNVRHLNRKLMVSILFDRILKQDCLENGWILVGFVSSVADLEIMEKHFFIIPNKIVFLHCRQYLCLDRIRARIIKKANINVSRYWNPKSKDIKYAKLGFLDLYSPCLAVNYTVTEMVNFCKNRREILKYCQDHGKYIAHIDGEHSVQTVTTLISGELEKFNF